MSERLWLKNYPVSMNLDYPEVGVYDYLKQYCESYPDMIALVFMGNEVTYKEMQDNINRVAAALLDLGIKKGDRIALMLPNCPQYVYAYYACMKIGATVVQMNPLYTPREAEHILTDSGARIYLGADAVFNSFHQVRDKVPVEKVIVTRLMFNEVEGDNLWLEELMQQYPPEAPAADIDPKEDVAIFQYTGGTTGLPKAAMLTQYNVLCNLIQSKEWIRDWIDEKFKDGVKQTYGISVLPFFHSYGMSVAMNTGLTIPSGQILVPRFEPEMVLDLIKKYEPGLFPAVPTMYTAIASHPDADKYNVDTVEVCNSGAAPMPIEAMKKFESKTGSKILEGYGLSEASPVTHCNPLRGERKPGSIGIPYPDTDAKIVDLESGTKEMPVGQEGELIVKGPQVMKGYWNRPEETASSLRDGWLYTGDIAKMDEDGYFYIVDRKKDMVLTGGYNVYPREIDEVLFEHPKVLEAVTAGIPDDYYGEMIKAYVVLNEGETATEDEIFEFMKDKLAKYKIPKEIEFRQELPKTNVGKILRRELVEEEKKKRGQK